MKSQNQQLSSARYVHQIFLTVLCVCAHALEVSTGILEQRNAKTAVIIVPSLNATTLGNVKNKVKSMPAFHTRRH